MQKLAAPIIYLVNHCFPFSSNGYAVRTHGVAKGLQHNGENVIVVSRPGMPWELKETPLDYQQSLDQIIDNIRYLCLPYPVKRLMPDKPNWLVEATKELVQLLKILKPKAILAASNWENAQVAMHAAQQLELPFYYEIRGFWELSRVAREPKWRHSQQFKTSYNNEAQLAKAAKRVYTLNSLMKAELIQRGVSEEKISIVPNSCIALPPSATTTELNEPVSGVFRIGYIGSFSGYEGLDKLITACAAIKKTGFRISLSFIGSSDKHGLADTSGTLEQSYLTLAKQHDFSDAFSITPRIPNAEIAACYQGIDLIVNPRDSHPVTELVSALKPIEALSYGKVLLLSSVAPNVELAKQTPLVHLFEAGNVANLQQQILAIMQQTQWLQQARIQGPLWIKQNRLFNETTKIMVDSF